MKIVVAPDSFKGSLSSAEITRICRDVIRGHLPEASVVSLPIADGGEGTLEVFEQMPEVDIGEARVLDPLGRKIAAKFAKRGDTFIVEMARASGINLLSENEKNPLRATNTGTGELIRCGLDLGYRKFITSRPMGIEEAIENARELLEDAVDRMMRFVL